jgi:hypothetical protein
MPAERETGREWFMSHKLGLAGAALAGARAIFVLGALVGAAFASHAYATTVVPDAIGSVDFEAFVASTSNTNTQTGINLSTTSGGTINGAAGASETTSMSAATGGVSIQPSPNISGSASAFGIAGAVVNLDLLSYFRVVGPTNAAVPVNIVGSGSVTANASNSIAVLYFSGPFVGTIQLGSACQFSDCSGFNNHSAFAVNSNQIVTANPNQAYSLELVLSLSVNSSSLGTSDFSSGFVDPTVAIDPLFLLQNPGFSLEFSLNAGNTPLATPLPGALPLFATGLGGLVLLGRRRKLSVVGATAAPIHLRVRVKEASMFRFIIPILSAFFLSIGTGPVKADTFHFSFTNVANGGGTVMGTVILNATNTAATSVTVDSNTAGFGLGQYVGKPFPNIFTVVSGQITSATFIDFGVSNSAPAVTCCSIQLALASSLLGSAGNDTGLTNTANGIQSQGGTGLTFTPVSAVSLPAALPLFVGGLGTLALLGWRRKKKAAALAT